MPKWCLAGSVLLAVGLCVGCGTSGPVSATTQYLTLDGNWEVAATSPAGSPVLPAPIVDFTGALRSTNGTVSGTFTVFGPAPGTQCAGFTQDLPVTGTLDSANNLTLNIAIGGGTATIQATLNDDLQTFVHGTYQVIGGACAIAQTAMSIAQFAAVTGTYTGTLTEHLLASSETVNVSAVLTQSPAPNADGFFPLSGSVTVSGACSANFSLTGGTVSGTRINSLYNPPSPLPAGVLLGATVMSGATIQADLSLYATGCEGVSFGGMLTRQ